MPQVHIPYGLWHPTATLLVLPMKSFKVVSHETWVLTIVSPDFSEQHKHGKHTLMS